MQSIITRLKAITAGLAAAALTACSTLQPQAQAPAPALWEVSDADSKIYLFGTIHLLPEGSNWRTPVLDAAIAASDALVTETLIGDDPAAQARLMMAIGVSPGLPPLVARVPEEKRAALAQTIADSGVPLATLDRLETWAAALVLSAAAFKKLGLDPKLGVERGLVADYDGEVRPKLGLETVEQQLGFFDGLSEASQRAFLESTLEDPTVARAEFQKMLTAWLSGDVAAIALTFDTELKQAPELRDVLIVKRNAAWAKWIDDRLEQPGTVMVAVGAGHLAGSDSVQAMLKTRGIEARRLQ